MLEDKTDGEANTTYNHALANALKDYHFDLMCFDASNMAHLEALYEYRQLADFIVASEGILPARGYSYHDFISTWQASGALSVVEVGQLLIDQSIAHYTGAATDVALALFDTGECASLISTLAALASEVTANANAESQHVRNAILDTFEPPEGDGERDLQQFLTSYQGRTSNPSIQGLAANTSTACEAFVHYSAQNGLPQAKGLPAYLPSLKYFTKTLKDEYRPLAFNQATKWLEMLEATGVPGDGSENNGVSFVSWKPGYRVTVEWDDYTLAVDPVFEDPAGNIGWPSNAKPVPSIAFSEDSSESEKAIEWGSLQTDALEGCYLFSLRYDDPTGPPSVTVHAWMNNELGPQMTDFGYPTIENGQTLDFVVLTYNGGHFAEEAWEPGDKVEMTWDLTGAEFDLLIRDPEMRTASPANPLPLDKVIEFSADSRDSDEELEWGKLLAEAPAGGYLVSVTYASFDGMPPFTVYADLKLYSALGELKTDLGTMMFAAGDFGKTQQGAILFLKSKLSSDL